MVHPDSTPSQFSLAQLLGLTTLAGVVFWLVRTAGLPSTILILGVVANFTLTRIRDCRTIPAGAFWGAVAHAAALAVSLAVTADGGEGLNLPVVWLVYVVPGAWLGAVTGLWRGAAELAVIDQPPKPTA